MSEQLEGARAKLAKDSRDKMMSIVNKAGDSHEIIIICTDLSGAMPTEVYIDGPSKDRVLLYGMLAVARDVVGMANNIKLNNSERP